MKTFQKMKKIISENIPKLTEEELEIIIQEIKRCLPFRYGNHGFLYIPNNSYFKEKYKEDIILYFELLDVFEHKLPFDELLTEVADKTEAHHLEP